MGMIRFHASSIDTEAEVMKATEQFGVKVQVQIKCPTCSYDHIGEVEAPPKQ